MSVGQQTVDALICHCYDVTEAQIRRCQEVFASETVEQVAALTSAGTGCTACHCRIRRLLAGLPASYASELCSTCGFAAGNCACDAA